MMISSAVQSGMAGINRGIRGLSQDATEIANAAQMGGSSTRDISKPLVGQMQDVRQVESSAKVIEASDEMIGRLLDVTA
jgi:hypothetical protein